MKLFFHVCLLKRGYMFIFNEVILTHNVCYWNEKKKNQEGIVIIMLLPSLIWSHDFKIKFSFISNLSTSKYPCQCNYSNTWSGLCLTKQCTTWHLHIEKWKQHQQWSEPSMGSCSLRYLESTIRPFSLLNVLCIMFIPIWTGSYSRVLKLNEVRAILSAKGLI